MKLIIATLSMMVSTAAFAVSVGPVLPPNLTYPSSNSSSSAVNVDYEATAVKAAQRAQSKYFTASTRATEEDEGAMIMVIDDSTGCQLLVSYENQNNGNVLFVPQSQVQCTK